MFTSTLKICRSYARIGWFRWILVVILLMPIGCSLFQSDPKRMKSTSDHERVFTVVRDVIAREFIIEKANRETGFIRTKWRETPSELKTKRTRVISYVRPPETRDGKVVITLRSEVQKVEYALKSYNTEQAEWDDEGRDQKLEDNLMSMIRFNLKRDQMEKSALEQAERSQKREERLEELNEKLEEGEASE